jgi:TPR repeat protein
MYAAAQLGSKEAQNNVGFYYMTGMAGKKDLKLAKKYLTLSANQGFEHAKRKLEVLEGMRARK